MLIAYEATHDFDYSKCVGFSVWHTRSNSSRSSAASSTPSMKHASTDCGRNGGLNRLARRTEMAAAATTVAAVATSAW